MSGCDSNKFRKNIIKRWEYQKLFWYAERVRFCGRYLGQSLLCLDLRSALEKYLNLETKINVKSIKNLIKRWEYQKLFWYAKWVRFCGRYLGQSLLCLDLRSALEKDLNPETKINVKSIKNLIKVSHVLKLFDFLVITKVLVGMLYPGIKTLKPM